jgi:hypothetical protein
LSPKRADIGIGVRLLKPRESANGRYSATMRSNTSSSKPIRSILFTASTTWRMPSSEQM